MNHPLRAMVLLVAVACAAAAATGARADEKREASPIDRIERPATPATLATSAEEPTFSLWPVTKHVAGDAEAQTIFRPAPLPSRDTASFLPDLLGAPTDPTDPTVF